LFEPTEKEQNHSKEGNTEKKNNGYVVFTDPTTFYGRPLDDI
jgi:hypothetical protein